MATGGKTTNILSTFRTIDKEISKLQRNISSASASAREFDASLKLDPSNVQLAQYKYNELSRAVNLTVEKLKKVEQKKQELDKEYADNKDSEKYKSLLKDLTSEASKYTAQLEALKVRQKEADDTLKRLSNGADKAKEKADKVNKAVDKSVKVIKKVTVAVVALVAGVTKLTKEMTNLGKELVSTAKKYQTTTDEIQRQSFVFYALTGDADAYTQSLQRMNSVMAQIVSGRGQSQLKSLAQIGLGKSDILGKGTAEAYITVLNAMREMGDVATNTAVAVKLFGDAGAYVAQVASADADEYQRLIDKFENSTYITQSTAESLSEMSTDLYLLQLSMKSAGAVAISNLAPTIKSVMDFVVKLSNGIAHLTETIGTGTTMFIFISSIISLKMIPSIVKLIASLYAEAAAAGVAATSTLAFKAALGGGILAIGSMIVGIGAMGGAMASANKQMSKYNKNIKEATQAAREYEAVASRLNTDLSVSTEKIETSSSSYNANLEITIKAEGDTAISAESAKQIGEIATDQINKALGGIVGK